ncbi:MAG TPA: hypothetical protein VNN17_03730, partial [Terriglobia bacterium]|nr:hypothetical protein [Terriglobia bacterium]
GGSSEPVPPPPERTAVAPPVTAAPSAAPQPLAVPGRPLATRALQRMEAQQTQSPQAGPPDTGAAVPAAPSGPPAAELAAFQETRERLVMVAARAAAVGRTLRTMEQAQARQGVGMRADMAAARDSMEYLLGGARDALEARDLATAKRNLDLAERALEKLENFLGR